MFLSSQRSVCRQVTVNIVVLISFALIVISNESISKMDYLFSVFAAYRIMNFVSGKVDRFFVAGKCGLR